MFGSVDKSALAEAEERRKAEEAALLTRAKLDIEAAAEKAQEAAKKVAEEKER
jgi:hypothetical protein